MDVGAGIPIQLQTVPHIYDKLMLRSNKDAACLYGIDVMYQGPQYDRSSFALDAHEVDLTCQLADQ